MLYLLGLLSLLGDINNRNEPGWLTGFSVELGFLLWLIYQEERAERKAPDQNAP